MSINQHMLLLSYFLMSEASKLNTVSLTGELELITDDNDLIVFNLTSDLWVDDNVGAHFPIRDIEFLDVVGSVLVDS